MTRPEFVSILTPLTLAMRTEMDSPAWTAYFRALEDVPVALLVAAVERLIREPLQFFPKAGELRSACEGARQAWLAARPWEPCELCELTPRFREVTDERGTKRLAKCSCWVEHLRLIEVAGMGTQLALPPARQLEEATS